MVRLHSTLLPVLMLTMFNIMGANSVSAATITIGDPTPGTITFEYTNGIPIPTDWNITTDEITLNPSNSDIHNYNDISGQFDVIANQDLLNEVGLDSWDFMYYFNQPIDEIETGDEYTWIEIAFDDGVDPQWDVNIDSGSVVPIPAAVYLFSFGLIGLLGISRYSS